MLVKHNLYINPKLKLPKVNGNIKDIRLDNDTLIIKGLDGILTHMMDSENNIEDSSTNYTIGFRGSYTGDVRMFKSNSYRQLISKGSVHYRTDVDSTTLTHIRAFTLSDIYIKQIFLTEGEPDIVIPNQKDFSEDIQTYYPPEGDYKDVEPVRG